MVAWTFLWPEPDMRAIGPADVIVCMGGGMDANGTLAQATLTRVERCVQLYEADIAPLIVFTGGVARPNGPSAGGQMMRYAQSLGLPADHGLTEGLSQSTLQNALFTMPYVQDAQDIIVVTEAFHLPRSWASFRWAHWQTRAPTTKTFRLVMSEDVRRDPINGGVNWPILVRESLAIWFNVGRAAAFSIASAAGLEDDRLVHWLH